VQGRNDKVRCAWGYKFGAPMFEPEVLRKQMYYSEKSAYDIAGTLPEKLCPLAPFITSLVLRNKNRKIF